MGEARTGHDFDGGEGGPAHGVAHHLEKGQLLEGVGFGEEVGGLEFGFDFGNVLGDVEGGVAAGRADAGHEVREGLFEHAR